MQYRTRSGRSPQGLQRVYFTGHPDNPEFARKRDIVKEMLEKL